VNEDLFEKAVLKAMKHVEELSEPKEMSKREYKDFLHRIIEECEIRIECVETELADEDQ